MPPTLQPAAPRAGEGASAEPSDRRREAILAAARAECLAVGVNNVRMESIAAAARVSKGTLYNHFANKDDLLLEMVLAQFRAGDRIVDAHIGTPPDPGVALDRLLDGLARLLDEQSGTSRLLFQAWAVVPREQRDRLDAELRSMFRAWGDQTREIIEDGQRDAVFRRDADARVVADAISALVSGSLFRSSFDRASANPDTLRRAFHTLVHERLLPPVGDPGP